MPYSYDLEARRGEHWFVIAIGFDQDTARRKLASERARARRIPFRMVERPTNIVMWDYWPRD